MKPHIVIKITEDIGCVDAPYWEQFIKNKHPSIESFSSPLDQFFKQYGKFWITREYPPRSESQFDRCEIDCGLNNIYRIILREIDTIPEILIKSLEQHAHVKWIRKGLTTSSFIPEYSYATGGFSIADWPGQMMGLPFAHALTKGRPDIKIAVLDTGVDRDHPEIQYVAEKDLVHLDGLNTESFIGDMQKIDDIAEDDVGHGTHVAGIIAAKGLSIPEGVAPHCSLIVVRVLATLMQKGKRVGAGLIDNINAGIKWAVDQGADVINMSLGVRHEHGGLPHEEVVKYALSRGVCVVAAAGNDGTDNKYYPGALPGVTAVGAVDSKGQIAPFSSYGAKISYLAPGTQILSSFRNGDYAASSGTSQASPFVSGAIALLKSFARDNGRELNYKQIDYILKHTSNRVDSQFYHSRGGYGVIHLADAFKLLRYELLH